MKRLYSVMIMLALALTFAVTAQAKHKNFKVSVYVRAYEVDKMKDTEWLESTWKTISDQLDVDKIYLETHRDLLSSPATRRTSKSGRRATGAGPSTGSSS